MNRVPGVLIFIILVLSACSTTPGHSSEQDGSSGEPSAPVMQESVADETLPPIDPQVMEQFLPPAPELEGIAVRLA